MEEETFFHIYIDDGVIQLVPVYDLTKQNPWNFKEIFTHEDLVEVHQLDLENEKRI